MFKKSFTCKPLTSLKAKSEPLILDIFLNHDSSPSSRAQLTVDFIKYLCYQKGQIPLPFTQLVNHLGKVKSEHTSFDKDDLIGLKMKEKMSKLKSQRNKLNFIKKGDTFTNSMDSICESVTSSFESPKSSQKIATILGTSIFNPKEMFVLDWSLWDNAETASQDNAKTIKQNQSTFFRFLVTADQLFSSMQSVKPTKLHVLCQTNCGEPIGCMPRSNYKFPPRGRKIILRILPKTPITPGLSFSNSEITKANVQKNYPTVSRRLHFPSPLQRARKIWKSDCDLDVSGVVQIEDDDTSVVFPPENDSDESTWFQIQHFVIGFGFST